MADNIFTVLVNTLNTISVHGESDMSKMLGVIKVLKEMSNCANSEAEGDKSDG